VAVKRALEGLKGIKNADVSFNEKKAVVTYDPAQINVGKKIHAVAQVGFQAREVGTPRAAGGQHGNGKYPATESK